MDEDFAAADYRLQYRRLGTGWSQYEDAYVGHDTDFLALDLDPNTDYMFRVCARGEGRTEWSPWSVAQTGYTTMEPHGMCAGQALGRSRLSCWCKPLSILVWDSDVTHAPCYVETTLKNNKRRDSPPQYGNPVPI